MSNLYAKQVASAKRIIAKYGAACQWVSNANGAPADPSKPWNVGTTQATAHTVSVAFLPLNERQYKRAQLIAKTEVPTGFYLAYMASVDFVPTLKDTVVDPNGQKYNVRWFDRINPNAQQDILYEIMVQA